MKRWWIALVILSIALDVWLARWWWLAHRERGVETYIHEAARRHRVEPALIKAVVWRESRFQAGARGDAGELGLMQIGRLAGQEWAQAERIPAFKHPDLLDPRLNTLAGSWYLSKLLRRYSHTDLPEAYALADYNAGRANVLRWTLGRASTNTTAFLAAMDFPTTRDYILAVLQRRERYRASLSTRSSPARD